ncbi:MAG: SpoIIE family protein phosphatase [Bacteroidales bacterium]|nr:SpoIIE family protein phosphatase [Bacteroidales bacterium]
MKKRSEKKVLGKSVRAGLLVVMIAIVTLEATSIIQYIYSQRGIKEEASQRAQSELQGVTNKIMDVVNQAEGAVTNSLWVAEWCLEASPDSLVRVPQRVVELNPVVVGSTIALVPGYNKKYPLYSPYASRNMETGKIETLSLATESYSYPSHEWFNQPMTSGEGYWSEPYFDEGGGEMLMTTFSMPVKDRDGRIAAILTADISLEWLTELMENTRSYPHAYNTVTSRKGEMMLCTNPDAHQSVDSDTLVFKASVERTGWTLAIIIPEDDLFAGVRKVGMVIKVLQLFGVALIVIILRLIAKNQIKYKNLSTQKELIQNELRIGHDIQMSLVPKTFPAFPKRTDLDIAACIVPAKEVGGDLYDFYIRDEKLFFCIGDVSGKGVPAALVMTVTQSLFRAISSRENSPAKIVSAMNDSMADKNENSMFVTFFCGVLDLAGGQLRYCNAGHNPAMRVGANESVVIAGTTLNQLPVESNIPLGLDAGFPFKEQETFLDHDDTLFLYTDGVTEAENSAFELFGEDRLKAALDTRRDAQGHLDATRDAIAKFVGETPQNDDITILVIHYLATPAKLERHLILHNDIQQIPQLAEFMETIAEEKGLSQTDTMSLNLALEETVTNVILYAYPDGSDGLVEIEAVLREHTLEFIITDRGVPFDPTAAPEADVSLSAEERSIGGLGIYLVRQLMDEIRYQRIDDKNVLTLIKNI